MPSGRKVEPTYAQHPAGVAKIRCKRCGSEAAELTKDGKFYRCRRCKRKFAVKKIS